MWKIIHNILNFLIKVIKGSQENHTHEREKLHSKFLELLDETEKKYHPVSIKRKVKGNVYQDIFELLRELEDKQDGAGLRFIKEQLK